MICEHRLCPECKRLLWQGSESYLCRSCWLIFDYKDTLEHNHPEVLKSFILASDNEKYRNLIDISSGFILTIDKEEEQKMFDSVPEKRRIFLEASRDIEKKVRDLKARDSILEQLSSMSTEELQNAQFKIG